MDILHEINKMQIMLGHDLIDKIEDSWKVFYEEDNGQAKGFVFLYTYKRLPYNPEYNTGVVAEIGVFTFPEYRHQGVCTRLIQQAIDYAKENRIDIVADCNDNSYTILKSLKFKDSLDHRVWIHCSD